MENLRKIKTILVVSVWFLCAIFGLLSTNVLAVDYESIFVNLDEYPVGNCSGVTGSWGYCEYKHGEHTTIVDAGTVNGSVKSQQFLSGTWYNGAQQDTDNDGVLYQFLNMEATTFKSYTVDFTLSGTGGWHGAGDYTQFHVILKEGDTTKVNVRIRCDDADGYNYYVDYRDVNNTWQSLATPILYDDGGYGSDYDDHPEYEYTLNIEHFVDIPCGVKYRLKCINRSDADDILVNSEIVGNDLNAVNGYISKVNIDTETDGGTDNYHWVWCRVGDQEIRASDYTGNTSATSQVFTLQIYDGEQSPTQQIRPYGTSTDQNTLIANQPSCWVNISSDLWEGELALSGSLDIEITGHTLGDGAYHWINLTQVIVWRDGRSWAYNDLNYRLQIYNRQTISLTVYMIDFADPTDDFPNYLEKSVPFYAFLGTDKSFYDEGETVLIMYRCPTPSVLQNNGYPSQDYYIWMYDDATQPWYYRTDGGVSSVNYDNIENYKCILDNQYHIVSIPYGGSYGYHDVNGGLDKYNLYIGHAGGGFPFGWFDTCIIADLELWVTDDTFEAHGNISNVNPNTPWLGQVINFTIDANNDGRMTWENINDPRGVENPIESFSKFTGNKHINYQFWDYGQYLIRLYVNEFDEEIEVDSTTLDITDKNGTYGIWGYGVEFLTSEPNRVIAGHDTVRITYRTLKTDGDTEIIIYDARNQRTQFSTTVNEGAGTLNISIPNYAEIGLWRVQMFGNDTLYTNFSVVADEYNYIEFARNDFYEGEAFEIKLKHNVRVEIVFYKDGVATGRDWLLEQGVNELGFYIVPLEIATPTEGNWRIELWQVNDLIKQRLLASDVATVYVQASDDPSQNIDDGMGGLPHVSGATGWVLGGIVTIVFLLLPLGLVAGLKSKGNMTISVPPSIYALTGALGVVLSTLAGFWGWEVPFFILAVGVIVIAIMWLQGQRGGGGE